jgi:cation transport ATPase
MRCQSCKAHIKALLDVRPDTVSVLLRNGAILRIHPKSDIVIGEIIQVRAGEEALDGLLLSKLLLQYLSVTGESKPDTRIRMRLY